MSKRFRLNTGGSLEICTRSIDVFRNSLVPHEIADLIEKLNGISVELVCDIFSQTHNDTEIREKRRYHCYQINNLCEGFSFAFDLLFVFHMQKSSHFEIDLLAELGNERQASSQRTVYSVMKLKVAQR